MHFCSLTLITLLFLSTNTIPATQPPVPGKGPKDQVPDEHRKFEGTWHVVSEVTSGMPADRQALADVSWNFTGKGLVIKRGGIIIDEGIMHLNPAKQPKEMEEEVTTGKAKGKREFAYYDINSDSCTIYYPTEKGEPRPAKLESTPKGGYVIKLRRTKPPGPVPHFDTRPDSTEKNAAVLYQRALDIIPTRHDLYEHESKLLDDWQTAPLNDATAALLDRVEPALRFLRHAATIPTCTWNRVDDLKKNGPASTHFISAMVPARVLANAVFLRARYLSSTGKPAQALEEQLHFHAFVRRLDGSQLMVLKIASITLERMALQELARHASMLKDVDALRYILRRYDALPSAASIAEVKRGEREWWQTWLTQAKLPETSPEQIKEWAVLHDEAVRVAALPYADRPTATQKLEARIDASRLRLGFLVEDLYLSKLYYVEDQIIAERKLFRTGLTVLIDGTQELQKSRDPFSGQPFQQRQLASGFELLSTLKDSKGQQVKLLFSPTTDK